MEALVKKARLSNDPLFEIQKCFEQDTQASVQYQNGYKPIANKELFPSYNNIAVGKNLHQFWTIIESRLISLCPKNNYPAKIDLIEFKKAAFGGNVSTKSTRTRRNDIVSKGESLWRDSDCFFINF